MFTVPSQRYPTSPALGYDLVHRDHDHLYLSQGITEVYHTDNIVLTGPSGKEILISQDPLVKDCAC